MTVKGLKMDDVISLNLKKEIEKHSDIVLLGLLIVNFVISA